VAHLTLTLRELLAEPAPRETGDVIDRLSVCALASDEASADPFKPGDAVASVPVLRTLGRGGMGTVWLAERSDGLLKLAVTHKLCRCGCAGDARCCGAAPVPRCVPASECRASRGRFSLALPYDPVKAPR
jgi:hypothetical protein